MTVSYVRSPSFHGHTTLSEFHHTSPPQSPIASCASSTSPSPVIDHSPPRAAPRASGTPAPAAAAASALGSAISRSPHHLPSSASAPVALGLLADAASIVVPNDRMEAGLSLRRSPLLPTHEFEAEPRTSYTLASRTSDDSAFLEDLESEDTRYEAAYTGDIDQHDRLVYRRPYVDRAFPHSKRRSQLIFEQKFHQHRSSFSTAGASEHDSPLSSSTSSPSALRTRRPGTAPQRVSVSPHTPESAPAHLDFANRAVITSSGGLRELTTGASAQPASKRASWIRRTREFEAHSDSHHTPSSSGLEAAAPITSSTSASRRHSSFLTGDYRTATLMPIIASKSFEIPPPEAKKRRSGIYYKSASPAFNRTASPVLVASSGLVGVKTSKRDSMLSTDSSATSSSKGEGRSVENVEFEGDDAHQQAQSSASSGCGDEESPATKPAPCKAQNESDAELKGAEVFTTPRSSAEHQKDVESKSTQPAFKPISVKDDSSATTQKADERMQPDGDAEAAAPIEQITDSSVDSDLKPAPAIAPSMLGQVVPPTPPAPEWIPPAGESVSPTSSPVKTFRSLTADESPRRALSSRSQTSLDSKLSKSPASPFGTLSIPNGKANGGGSRRDSSTSIGSAASSTSTYRIRRKPVPSDADDSERRPSVTSGSYSDAAGSSPQQSPAQQSAPLPTNKDEGVPTIQHTRSTSGSDFIRMAQEAAQARMGQKGPNGLPAYLPAKSSKRPSTAAATTGAAGQFGLGIGKVPQASASSRDLSAADGSSAGTSSALDSGAPAPTASRTPSRATIKRPTTAPVGSGGQFRVASDATQKSVLEVEGMQFILDKDDPVKGKTTLQDSSPSIPNAVRFMQHQRVGSGDTASISKRDSFLDAKRKSASIHDSNRSDGASTRSASFRANAARNSVAAAAPSAAGGWGLEQELKIVDKVRNTNSDAQSITSSKPRPASMDKSKKALDAAAKANMKNTMLMNIINEDESEEVKAAAREAGIPEGSYAIHPPSMLQLFEASQCLVYDQQGQEVIFGDLFKKRRTLVCFLRHWWCGFCQQFAMSIRKIDPLPLKKANLDFVIVGQGDWHVIKAYREVMQVPYPMYADPKRNVYRALGMTLRTNDANPVCARPDYASMSMTKGILVAIKKGLFDMPIRNPGDMKLLGGDFILGPGLQCSFTHRMTTADGHMDLPRILAQAGCDLSLKTPKPMFTVEEKEARTAMLAGGNQNRRQTRSLGRSRGKKSSKTDAAAMMDTSFGSASGSAVATSTTGGSTNSRFGRPSLWGRFPSRFSKSQVSLPTSGSMADLSSDFAPARGLGSGPRSASAMRKISYDGRVRESFETQQTDIEFESRATSFDTRGGRPSDVSAPAAISSINKAQSMSELRKRFEMGSSSQAGLGSLRTKSRQEPSAAKSSLESHLAVPANNLHHSASSKLLRAAHANGSGNGATTPTQQIMTSSKQGKAAAEKVGQNGSKPLSIFRNNVIARSNGDAGVGAPAATGLGIATMGDDSSDGAVGSSTGDKTMIDDATAITSTAVVTPTPVSMADLSAPGSFLMDLDVYDSLSRQPSQKYYGKTTRTNDGKPSTMDHSLSPSQFSDSGFGQEAADSDSDTEPPMSATQSPARSIRTTANGSSNSSPSASLAQSNSFYSFNTFRGKTNLEHLVEEADEDESDEHPADASRGDQEDEEEEEDSAEENDEPIEFEDGRNGIF
ncbi:uncharacterized protein UTRI_04843 [Ustilago trichophora]|uniref:Thioredoxin domain-containing protein n=1 Tax=Ustilago trichophora TaxID=86804 RepID=A0A5C3EFP9_9BASI|nr:uncharacterized protein UTRI_04843 [Ustilago trichophora]